MKVYNPENGAPISHPSLGGVFAPGDTIEVDDFMGARMINTWNFLSDVTNTEDTVGEVVKKKTKREKIKKGDKK